LRVLILGCKDYPAFRTSWVHSGGMEVYVERMIRSLAGRAEFTLLAAGGESDHAARVVPLGARRGLRTQPVSLLLRSLKKLVREGAPYDVLNPQTPLSALAARFAKRRWNVPYVVTVQIFGADPMHAGSRAAAWLYSKVEKLVFRDSAAIIPTGRRLADGLRQLYPGIEGKIRVVTPAGSGVREISGGETRAGGLASAADEPFSRAGRRERLGLGADQPVLLFLGRLIEENGIVDLLKAVVHVRQRIPEVRLVIAGSGDRETEVTETIRSLGLDSSVRQVGAVRGERKLDWIEAADLVVRTSYHEVYPEAYLEALSVGTPVAATPAGDTPDLAEESGAVALLPFRDPAGQAAILERLLLGSGERETMSRSALEYSARVTWDRQKERYWAVLQEARGSAS